MSSSVSIDLSDIEPGNYYLKTIASYKGGSAKATSSFNVVKKGVSVPVVPVTPSANRCPVNCDDEDKCTNDYCSSTTNYECRHDKKYPCCGNGICEDGENYENCIADCEAPAGGEMDTFAGKTISEKLEIIKDIAKRDKEEALKYCSEIEQAMFGYQCFTNVGVVSGDKGVCLNIADDSWRDSCYREIASETKNSDICADITKESKRDQCYMDFVTDGDYTVCDKLINKYLKQSCESLKKLSEAPVPSNIPS